MTGRQERAGNSRVATPCYTSAAALDSCESYSNDFTISLSSLQMITLGLCDSASSDVI